MGKNIPTAVKDVGLDYIADNGDTLHICSAEPATFEDVPTVSLGSVALTPGVGNGDYVKQAGVVSGRRLSLNQQTVTGSADGTGNHVVIIDTPNMAIRAVTTCPDYEMVEDVPTDIAAYDVWEIKNPA